MSIEATVGIFIVVLFLIYIYYKHVLFNFWHKRGVYCMEPTVPMGNMTEYVMGKKSLSKLFQDAYMKCKDHRAFGMYSFFRPTLVIADLDLIRMILTKEFKSFHDRGLFCNDKTDPLSGNLIFLPGKKWRNLRVQLTPTFTSGKIKQMFTMLKDCGKDLTKYLESESRTRDTFEFKDLFARYTTDIIMSTTLGIKSNCIAEGENEFRRWGRKFFEIKAIWNVLLLFMPKIMNWFSIRYIDPGVTKFFTKLFQDNVEFRKKNNVVKHDFMNLLIQLMDKGYTEPDEDEDSADTPTKTNKLTMLEAAAQAFIFFVAGFETSSTTGTYCLYELAQNQDIQDKLRQEINQMIEKHGDLTYEAVNEMTYLHQVVQETMRKYPPVSILSRICTKEIILPTTNIHVSEGTLITIPVFGMHRDPSIYPDPEKFDPERFNADQVAARHSYAYLPFGEGPRICIGSRFAYLQTKIGIINILTKFKVKLHSQTLVPLIFDGPEFILTAKGAIKLIIESI